MYSLDTPDDRQRFGPHRLLGNNADACQLWSWSLVLLQARHLLCDHALVGWFWFGFQEHDCLLHQRVYGWQWRGGRRGVHRGSGLAAEYFVACHLSFSTLLVFQVRGHRQTHLWSQVLQRPQPLLKIATQDEAHMLIMNTKWRSIKSACYLLSSHLD